MNCNKYPNVLFDLKENPFDEANINLKIRLLKQEGNRYLVKIYATCNDKIRRGRPKERLIKLKFSEKDFAFFIDNNDTGNIYVSYCESSLWQKGLYIIEITTKTNIDLILPKDAYLYCPNIIISV